MRYWYCKDDNSDDVFLYIGTVQPVKDEDGEWANPDDETADFEWMDEEDIADRFGDLSLGVFPGISRGEIVELSIKLVVTKCE